MATPAHTGRPADSWRYGSAKNCASAAAACRIAILFLLIAVSGTAAAATNQRILIVSADPHTAPGLLELELSFRRAIADSISGDVDIDVEHLDLVYNMTPELSANLVTLFHNKYLGREPDIIVPIGISSLRFVLAERMSLFPKASILFGHVLKRDIQPLLPAHALAGVLSDWSFAGSLDTALRLLPDTRRAIVILGSGPFERAYEPVFRQQFERFKGRVAVDWWVGLPMQDLERRIARLPAQTVIIYIAIYRDNAGGSFIPMLAMERLARSASAPIFSAPANFVGRGVVGDGRLSFGEIGTALGKSAVRILKGEPAQDVGIVEMPPAKPLFDGRQLKRWNIPRGRLPIGSVVAFEEPSLWQQHRMAVAIGIAVILVQTILLAALLAQRYARQRAEESELESQRLHKSVIDSLDERIATIDHDGTIVAVNRAWAEFVDTHGNGSAVRVGDNYLDAVKKAMQRGQDDARRTVENLTAVLDGRDTSRQLAYFSTGEGEGWRYDMRIVSLQRPSGGAIITIQDVTDRWRSEERVRVTLESLPVATVLIDHARRIELVNAEAERLFGYNRGELLGRSLRSVIPQLELNLSGNADQAAAGSEASKEPARNTIARRKDGSEVNVDLHLRDISMSNRRMTLASVLDLTERRHLDREMQRLRDEAAHFGRVAAVGEMSAAIAHELNQPLTGILTNCQAAQLSMEHGSFTQDDVAETFSDIVADTRRAGEVIQRLRLMLRKAPMEARPLDLNEMAHQVMRLVSHDLALRGAALDLELTEDLPPVAGDRVHLQQVILNLILNGADAMASLPVERRRMRLRTVPGSDRTVELELRDSGPGIAPEAMPHLFEPFFTTKPNGMGMGLSIVRSIIETHGGRITCANAASGGAVFTVVLPAQGREAA